MKTCKDCVRFDACVKFWYSDYDSTSSIEETKQKRANQEPCGLFKDASLCFVQPCKIGTEIYGIHDTCDPNGNEYKTVYKGKLVSFCIEDTGVSFFARYDNGLTYWHSIGDLGKKVFFSEREAEKVLSGDKDFETCCDCTTYPDCDIDKVVSFGTSPDMCPDFHKKSVIQSYRERLHREFAYLGCKDKFNKEFFLTKADEIAKDLEGE